MIIRFGGSFPPWSEPTGDNLVTRALRAAVDEVFADFDPLSPEKL